MGLLYGLRVQSILLPMIGKNILLVQYVPRQTLAVYTFSDASFLQRTASHTW